MARPEIVNPIGIELDETARRARIRWDDGHCKQGHEQRQNGSRSLVEWRHTREEEENMR